jgi:hypothetical protein
LLGETIDGGNVLAATLRHPLRPPTCHPPERVRALLILLSEAWEQAMERHPVPPDDWYRVEIEKVLEVFRDAAARGNCIVKLLHPPADTERARHVLIPLEGRSDQRAEA